MEIRKLETWQELMESDRIIATAFLHGWNEEEAEQNRKERTDPEEDVFAAFSEEGKMIATANTRQHRVTFEGGIVPCTELHMIGTLPEARGTGAVRNMMETALDTFRARGDVFAFLIPFSFPFYRKFGFELASAYLEQTAGIGQFAAFRCTMRTRQVMSQEDVNAVRKLSEAMDLRYNLCMQRPDAYWEYKGNGEFGNRDWMFGDRQKYTYLFSDETGKARAFLTFLFVSGPNGPMTGTAKVTDMAYDSPEALRSILGFINGLRAKLTDVTMTMPAKADLALLLPECDKVERKIGGHYMGRVLDPEKALRIMHYPQEKGSFRIHIEDRFMDVNTGTYAVAFENGEAAVEKCDAAADIIVTGETFFQLVSGLIGPEEALYREGTELLNRDALDTLRNVFVHRQVFLH